MHIDTHNTYNPNTYLHCIKLADVTRAHYWLLGERVKKREKGERRR